jgi:hypothetical protein
MTPTINQRHAAVCLTAVLGAALLVVAVPARAGRISVDFQDAGTPGDVFGSSGLFMSFACPAGGAASTASGSCDITGLQNNGSEEVQLGFNMDIAGTTYKSVFVNENGLVTFGSAAPTTTPTATTIAGLQSTLSTTDFIAASYADLAPGDGGISSVLGSEGGMMFQRGLGLPDGPAATPTLGTDPSGRPALAIVWSDPSFRTDPFRSELILYSLDPAGLNGDFAFRLAYDNVDPLGNPESFKVLAGYSLGNLSATFAEPFDPKADIFFTSVSTPTPVSEPATAALFTVGLVGLIALRRRRVVERNALS